MAPNTKFMEAFDFTESDLISNRQGEMSLSQKEKTLKHGTIVFATFAGVGFLLAVLLVSDFSKKQVFTTPVAMFFCIVIFAIFLLIGLAFLWGAWSATKPGALRCVSGQVFFQLAFFRTTRNFFESNDRDLRLCIEGFRLRVKDPAAARHLFIPGAIYNVYFSPILGKVFSVEMAKNYIAQS